MVLAPRLDLRQRQNLVMTPQLRQAIKLLQFNNIELADYVEKELEQNPLLELDEDSGTDGPGEPAFGKGALEDFDGADFADEPPKLETMDLNRAEGPGGMAEAALDADMISHYEGDSPGDRATGIAADFPLEGLRAGHANAGGGGSLDADPSDLEDTLTKNKSLREYLLEQVGEEIHHPGDRMIAGHLVDLLDDSGYLTTDLEQEAQTLGCETEDIEAVLGVLQQFDPAGIFARNLSECLRLQLREKDRLDPAMRAMLDNLDLLGRRDIDGLILACGVGAEDIADMLAEIRALNPKPALVYDSRPAQPVVADVLMNPRPGGGWIVELNSDTLPKVLVNNQYFHRVGKDAMDKKEKQYLTECFQSANWLVKSLHQRATTILKVASELVRQQDLFFIHGVSHLKPLVLRDVAEVIEMHESTVSRVTSNKYIATPRGIFELKYFFTTAIASAGGGVAHSAEAIRHRIKSLIEAESKKKVLSDDKIVDILRREGIDIARRTVAKYREAMGIASSVQRRREKNARF